MDSSEELIHVLGLEGWPQCKHLVDYAAERPDVRLEIVGLVSPDLRRGVVRSSRLCAIHAGCSDL